MGKSLREKANEFAEDRFDYVLEERHGSDFIELVGSIGGDILTYRIYENGIITER